MSNAYHVLLVLTYLLPVVLLAALLAREPKRTPLLVVSLLLVLPVFYIGHFLLLQQFAGWPSDAPLPERFRLLAFQITEPDPRDDSVGQILMWIATDPEAEPRAHRLAYHKDLHQALVAAGERQREGQPQTGVQRDARSRAQAARPGSRSDAAPSISFHDEKRPALPSKDAG